MITQYYEIRQEEVKPEKKKAIPKKKRMMPLDEGIEYADRIAIWLRELERKRKMLDDLEEAFLEMTDWDFIEYCEKLWGDDR